MISPRSEFKFLSRGAEKTILLIPGWAADWRIFDSLDIPYNYLMTTKLRTAGFEDDVLASLNDNGLNRISVLGWSMGAFLAAEFASGHREKIENLILVGARKRYDKADIEKIRALLIENRRAYLYKFYGECLPDEGFRKNLMRLYLDEIDVEALTNGLDYLSEAEIRAESLNGLKIKFIHGDRDRIAPMDEALQIKEALPEAEFVKVKDAGHMPYFAWTRI